MLAGAGVAGAALAAGLALAAHAQPGPGHGDHMFMMMHHGMEAMDANKDGVVTRDEFLAHPSQMFDRLDANHDGKVTRDELAAMHEHMIQVCRQQGPAEAAPHDIPCPGMGPGGPGMHMMMMRHMEGLDVNHDGRISFDELQEPLRKHFTALDRNNNGFIDKDELPGGDGAVVIEKRVEKH
jgi:Ca2+-binding EF-hand superfamily protein